MAKNIFMGDDVTPLGAVLRQQETQDPKAAVNALSARHQVPPNVILALAEAGGADSADKIEALAQEAGLAAKSGKGFQDILRERGGDALLERAYQIADERAGRKSPAPVKPEGGFGAAARAGWNNMQQSFGSAVEGLGAVTGMGAVEKWGAETAAKNAAEAEDASRGLTRLSEVDSAGDAGAYAVEAVGQNAPQMGMSIGAGLAGAAAGGAIGSVVPIIGTGLGAVVGGIAGGLGVNIPMFYGQNRERQKESIERGIMTEMDEGAAFLSAIPQATVDTITDRLLVGKLIGPLAKAGGGLLTRAAQGAGKGVIAEVPTEIGQQMIERAQAGLPLDDDEAIAEYTEAGVAAGLLGGGIGGVSGALERARSTSQTENAMDQVNADEEMPQPEPAAQPSILALPSPTNGGTIIGSGPTSDPASFERQPDDYRSPGAVAQQPAQFRNTGTDGSGAGAAAAPQSPPLDPSAGGGAAATLPPAGPIEAIARLAPDMTPVPEAPAPEPMFPDQKPGAKLRLYDPETDMVLDGVFQREIPGGGAVVRIDGGELELDAQTFDRSLTEAARRDEALKAPKPASGSLSQKALAVVPKEPPRNTEPPQSAEQLAAAISAIEMKAASDGWTPGLMKRRDKMRAQIDALSVDPETGEILPAAKVDANGPQQPANAPLGLPSPADAGTDGAVQPERGAEGAQVPAAGRDAGSERPAGIGAAESLDAAVAPGEPAPALSEGPASRVVGEDPVEQARRETQQRLARLAEIEAGLTEQQRATVKRIVDQAEEMDRWAARRGALSAFAGEADPLLQPSSKNDTRAFRAAQKAAAQAVPAPNEAAQSTKPTITDIRERAAVLRGWPKDNPPALPKVSIKWDEKEGGFIFSRSAKGKVQGFIDAQGAASLSPAQDLAPAASPAAAQIEAAAAETNPEPTPAQAEAENYKTGKTDWQGLKLSIENKKGGTRRKVGKDGATLWEVTMPAHYGRILGTKGADGDHVDFYMGDNPDSPSAWVIDQVDADTGRFDEHKVMLGFDTPAQAKATYLAGFSDGKGKDRLSGIRKMTTAELTDWLQNGDTTAPVTGKAKAAPKAKTAPTEKPLQAAPNADSNVTALRVQPLRGGPARTIYSNLPNGFRAEVQEGKGTQIWNAQGAMIVASSRQWSQAEVEAAARGEQVGGTKTKAKPTPWVYKGQNSSGNDVFEDQSGVRSYVENGVRVTETVSLAPTLEGGMAAGVNLARRGSEFKTAQETSEAKDQNSQPKTDAIKSEAETVAKYLTQQIEREKIKARDARAKGDGQKAAIADANLRRLRMNTFAAEDAANEALNQGLFAPFAKHEADFPLAAAQLRSAIGRIAPMANDAPAAEAKADQAPKAEKAKAAGGILSVLSDDKQKRADELKARLAAKARNQASSGLDPEYITLGAELVGLYIEAGTKRFGQMLRDFAETTGLTMKQAQEPMRAAYNHVRDSMDLNGEDVSDMDDAKAVLDEVRKAIAAEASPSQEQPKGDMIPETDKVEEPGNDQAAGTDRIGARDESGERQTDSGRGVGAGEPARDGSNRNVAAEPAGSASGDAGTGGAGSPGARRRASAAAKDQTAGTRGVEPVRRRDGVLSRTDDAGRLKPKSRPNYVISDPEALFGGTPKRRFAKNKAAIEAYQRITDESREPTAEELDAMAAYIGWGSFGQDLFQGTWDRPIYRDGWKDENDWLRAHLGKEEWQAAQNSIINAHYTDPPTVQTMWRMAEQMGFKGGRVLEPSMGIGNFFGMMPPHLAKNSDLTGIELDRLTGGMAKLLYPRANVQIMGYEQSKTADNFYDLVIGNWPFANFEVPDRRYMKLAPNLHDYFFIKALDQVRPGGIVMGITSAGTMDKQGRLIRNHLAKNAELVASFRLPSGAFEQYAGTAVVTDLIILRKREAPILDASQEGWTNTEMVATPAGTDVRVNEYYAKDRSKVLGTLNFGSGTTYGRAAMIVDRPSDLMDQLAKLHTRLPQDAYVPVQRGNEPRFVANNTTDPQRSFVERDGALYQVQGDRLVALEDVVKYRVKDAKKTAEREAQFRSLIGLRKKLGAVLDADRDGTADAEQKRADLKKAYQAFVAAHGKIRDSYAIDVMWRLKDPGAAKLKALETPDGKPASIMEKATTRAVRSLENPTITDAFVLARNESTVLDLDRVADLAKTPRDQVVERLVDAKAIFRTPGVGFEASDIYLSGNVRQKLKDALAAKDAGEDMDASIEALKSVVPADVPYFNIEAKLGAMWIPSEVYRDYLAERFGLPDHAKGDVTVRYSAGAWRVGFPTGFDARAEVKAITGGAVKARQFIRYALNNQTIVVKSKDEDGNDVRDEKESEKANQLASELRQNFAEWVWKEPERRSNLESAYNDAMNAVATPAYDGSFMDFAGMALTRGEHPFNLRSHQSNAIWRGVLNGRGIYAHEVGTGKTITMAGLAVESRRYGVARKPLIIAHNANSKSVFNEIQDTYPGGKFLYVDNLAPAEIDATLNRIATDDWDGIVVPHSLIDRLSLKEETLMAMAAEEIAQYEQEALDAAKDDDASLTIEMMDDEDAMKKVRSITAKQLVKARNQIIAKIKKQALQASKENAVTFEDLGVDMIIVDEAHEFKKPPVATRMTVRGLQKQVSSRSLQLRFLTDYVKGQRGGKGVHVFTGTPITNTLTEIYHQMRYVMDDVMRQSDVAEWDGFFNTFAASVPDVELTATGEYESVERLAAFVNVAELRRMAGQFMDIVFADDMPEFKPRTTKSGKTADAKDLTESERDELLNGRTENPKGRPYKKVIHDIADMDAVQREILVEQTEYARRFKQATGKVRKEIMARGGPDAPIVFNAVPTRAGLDARLHRMDAQDSPLSKASRAVRNVTRIYNEDARTTQVIFMDEGYSDSSSKTVKNADGEKIGTEKVARFNLAKDIRDRLIEQGIPAHEIAIVDGSVSKDKRAEIAQKMNRMEIRVVIGLTSTLGVGVNMQENLRAMHHLDAPWMPGDLEQRNGRGHRQGNKWNTVLEYRYLTEGLDGRRWQVLTIKDRFIKAFLKADANLRVIEGDATDDATSMNADDLSQTLAEAAGDPRILQAQKLEKDIDRLQRRERIHGEGIADAKRSIRRLEATKPQLGQRIAGLERDIAKYEAARADGFVAEISGAKYDERAAAQEAFDAVVKRMKTTDRERFSYRDWAEIGVSVQGFKVRARRASYDDFYFAIEHDGWNEIDTLGKPSIAAVEAGLRRFSALAAAKRDEVAQNEASIARLQVASEQPFQQADILAKKRTQHEALLADMQSNPVPPPSWLRQGAPIDTLIYVDGEPQPVTGHRWTKDGWFILTDAGQVDYLQAKDEAGIAIFDERPFVAPEVSEGTKLKTGEEGEAREMRVFPAPVATLTGKELGEWEDMRQLGKKAEAWYRANLVGKTVVNKGSGISVSFRREGAKKVSGRKGDVLMRLVPALEAIISSGRLIATEADQNGKQDIKSWHTISAAVVLEGKPRDVVVKVKETRDGAFHYDLSRDLSDGARHLRASGRGDETTIGLEDNPVELNLQFAEPLIKPVEVASFPALSQALAREMRTHGLAGKISPRVVRGLVSAAGIPILGRQRGAQIEVNADAPDAVGVMRHEIIHALRDPSIWGTDYGLFTQTEWQALVKAARADEAISQRVERDYADKSAAVRSEEKVAELYREWAGARDGAGQLGRIFAKVRALFRAMASGLRGEGFTDAALVMDRIASGKIGGRGPQGPGMRRGGDMEMRGNPSRRPVTLAKAIIAGGLASITSHPEYSAAKAGDIQAAVRLARDIVTDDLVDQVRKAIGEDRPSIVPIVSEEATGRNKIPQAAAEVLALRLGLVADVRIVQSNAPRRTGLSGLDRIFAAPEFDGPVEMGQDYLLVDDTLTQGATFAALASHIEANGGRIIGAVALTGKQYSATLSLSPETLSALREKHGSLEQDFIAATGYGFDSLTESEARYLTNFKPADAFRDRVAAERSLRGSSQDQGSSSEIDDGAEMRASLMQTAAKAQGMIGSAHWKDPGVWVSNAVSNLLTDSMGAGSNWSSLALVPGRALFAELGKRLPSAQRFLKAKDAMDALRNDWQAKSAEVMEAWYDAGSKNHPAREQLHDLMHRTTIAGVDPSKPDTWRHALQTAAERDVSQKGYDGAQDWARDVMDQVAARKRTHKEFKAIFDTLPKEFQDIFVKARNTLNDLADDMDRAVLENVEKSIKLSIKRAQREHAKALEDIRDQGLKGAERDEAIAAADAKLLEAKKMGGFAAKAKMASLRKVFESNRLKGPYFPLARFGNYFVTVRNADGEVISFARFERAKQQEAHIKEMEALHPGRVKFGVLDQKGGLRGQVDPRFVADVEKLLMQAGADTEVMDAVWQRYLETLPDMSVRKSKIHRKGREGFYKDALRAFASHTMHGAHQLARLKHGLDLEDALDDAFDEAAKAEDPNRAKAVVNEMQRRKDWIMNPTNAAWSSKASSLAFVWYLGVSPAAALINLSQTTVIGPAVMKAKFQRASVTGIVSEIARATKEFGQGQGVSWKDTWSAENAASLNDDERAALREGYKRGTIDKTQAHDLAAVAESGVEFSPFREKWMKRIGWAFHHAERVNREVTMLAAYRLARRDGLGHDAAIEAAIDVTWRTHFSYQNSDRPRFMQDDYMKVLTQFRQYSVNLLFRLFRDAHQSLYGATKEDRAEARTQLIGISLSMFAHAGIKGVWGYGLLMMLLGMFFPGGDDDAEKWLQDALLMEGDSAGTAAWNWTMGAALNGVPGRVLGVDLSERIGMPNLWFRGDDRDLEGEDLVQGYVNEILGPTVGILFSLGRAGQNLVDGEVARGIEGAVPKFMRDILRTRRYAAEGVRTKNGDTIVEDISPLEMLWQANGFTPARIAERYEVNSRLKNAEQRIMDERKDLHRAAGDAARAGDPIPADVIEAIQDFNTRYPEYPITAETIRQSVKSRQRASERNEFGVSLNPKINDRLRAEQPPAIYQ